jgi:hypothetical protein
MFFRRRRPGPADVRKTLTALLALAGVVALVDGFAVAVREDDLVRHGFVVPGVVVERLSSTGEAGTRGLDGRGRTGPARAPVGKTGLYLYEAAARLIQTRSRETWAIDYRFSCAARGMCYARDLVQYGLWDTLREGDTVSVRRQAGDSLRARLERNPQMGLAFVKVAISCVLFAAAYLTRGGLKQFAPKYKTAPAVVTAVEPVAYGNDRRWKIRFAYFDAGGHARESIDEVNDPSWNVNDECVAVYRPQAPDMATLSAAQRNSQFDNSATPN